ncbi:MAG: L-ribulose-5-phosphate 4-epimerase AraD [Candidatus Aminicenantes bacterium]|nr:L-ribulose-5-phosphate 4-epimerase AraD [Candidatus Aminicenantes bacterium]MDH5383578.1 L-ribulose-5-phosphate 4-epimerase AraD [Candidatus Aminicenantes bacterium]MDH5742584.1 L-ribulose-5-phosphate 4-epimerase AraD [Candidatus Aminicenantes bacterium]
MLLELKELVWKANLDMVKYNLVTYTFGNVSGMDRGQGLVVIKPSGMGYEELMPDDMVVVDLEGKTVEGRLNPSSDTPSHIEIYKAFQEISGITHTHSEYAAMFAQANREIPCLGTTHADHFHGTIPITRMITEGEIEENYEKNTGKVVVERFSDLEPMEIPGVLVVGHGAFTWGRSPGEAVLNSLILEKVAKMAWGTLMLNAQCEGIPRCLLNKHFQRKHGPDAYYGQKNKEAKK